MEIMRHLKYTVFKEPIPEDHYGSRFFYATNTVYTVVRGGY